jgi:TPR repeat protein
MIYTKTIIYLFLLCLFIITKNQLVNAKEIHEMSIYNSIDETLKIGEIKENYPAHEAGLRVNDIIIKIGNFEFNKRYSWGVSEFNRQINEVKNNQTQITVIRNKKKIKFKITPKQISTGDFVVGVKFTQKCKFIAKKSQKNSLRANTKYWECKHKLALKKYAYLKNLSKKSNDYETLLKEKIYITGYLAENFVGLKSKFNFNKSVELYMDAHNLAKKQNKTKGKYVFNDLYTPAYYAEKLGDIYSNSLSGKYDFTTLEDFIDYPKAVKWYSFASKENNAEAMYKLGKIYLKDSPGIRENKNKAFKLISRSSRIGLTKANSDLAFFYLLGLGDVNKNFFKSIIHFKLANMVLLDNTKDYYHIFILYKYNRAPKDKTEYYFWLTEELINFKNLSSIEKTADFALIYLKDYSEAYKWYEICAKDIKSSAWSENLKYLWKTRLHERCTKKKNLLKKNYLSKKEIEESKNFSKEWISTYIF